MKSSANRFKETTPGKQGEKEKYDSSTESFTQGLCRGSAGGSRGSSGASQIPRVDTPGPLIVRASVGVLAGFANIIEQ